MSKHTFNPRLVVLLCIIVLAAASRIPNAAEVTPWAHVTPIGAIALFGGAYFTRWKAFVFPMLALLLSDLAINLFVHGGKYGIMHGGWYKYYGIFILIILAGRLIIRKVTVQRVVLAAITAALLHWLLADLAVWIGGGRDLRTLQPLSRDMSGLIQSYIQGFPFMKIFFTGTIVYSSILFGIFEWMKRYNPALKLTAATNQENQNKHLMHV